MNVYWAIPYTFKTVTFSEEKRQKPNMFFLGFQQAGEQWIV